MSDSDRFTWKPEDIEIEPGEAESPEPEADDTTGEEAADEN